MLQCLIKNDFEFDVYMYMYRHLDAVAFYIMAFKVYNIAYVGLFSNSQFTLDQQHYLYSQLV